MKWQGTTEFKEFTGKIREELRVGIARVSMEAGKETRDRALEGFTTYNIRLITGRSRALYAVRPGEGMFEPGATRVSYEVGYLNWPKHDRFSPSVEIPFYPYYLNYGTPQMSARPFHTNAVESVEAKFSRRASEVFDEVLAGRKQAQGDRE